MARIGEVLSTSNSLFPPRSLGRTELCNFSYRGLFRASIFLPGHLSITKRLVSTNLE